MWSTNEFLGLRRRRQMRRRCFTWINRLVVCHTVGHKIYCSLPLFVVHTIIHSLKIRNFLGEGDETVTFEVAHFLWYMWSLKSRKIQGGVKCDYWSCTFFVVHMFPKKPQHPGGCEWWLLKLHHFLWYMCSLKSHNIHGGGVKNGSQIALYCRKKVALFIF